MNLRYVVNGIGIYIDPIVEKSARRFVFKTFTRQLDGFEADESRAPEVIQKINVLPFDSLDFDSFGEMRVFPENSIYVPEDDLFIETHLRIGMKIEPNLLTLWVDKFSSIPPPLLFQFLLIQRQQVFVHSCGLSVDGKGILFPGFGGVGKTAIITRALKTNPDVKLLGDDLVLVQNDGTLHSYARPFCIYPYHVPLFEPFMKNENIHIKPLNLKNKIIRKLKVLLDMQDNSSYRYKTISPLKVIGPDRVADQPVSLTKVCLLNRYRGIKKLEVKPITNYHTAVDYCVSVLGFEWNAYYRLFAQLHAHRGESPIPFLAAQQEILSAAFQHADEIVEIKIPLDYTLDQVSTEVLETFA